MVHAVRNAIEAGFDFGDEIGPAAPGALDNAGILDFMNEESAPLAARRQAGNARALVLEGEQPWAALLEPERVRAYLALRAGDAQTNAAPRIDRRFQDLVNGHRPPQNSAVESSAQASL